MVAKRATTTMNAMERAAKARKMGFKASIFKKKKGYGVSVTRK